MYCLSHLPPAGTSYTRAYPPAPGLLHINFIDIVMLCVHYNVNIFET